MHIYGYKHTYIFSLYIFLSLYIYIPPTGGDLQARPGPVPLRGVVVSQKASHLEALQSILGDFGCVTSLVAQIVKRLPTMPTLWETQVQSLGQEDLLEKEMATHSSSLAWKIP